MASFRSFFLLLTAVLGLLVTCRPGCALPEPGAPADFRLVDYLGRKWEHECVTFPLTTAQLAQVTARHALVDAENVPVVYQLAQDVVGGPAIAFQTSLAPFQQQTFHFTDATAATITDLTMQETAERITLANQLTGITIPKILAKGQGPIESIKLNSGKWVGGSRLTSDQPLTGFTATVTARGPVFTAVTCKAALGDASTWEIRFRLEAGEPVVRVDESSAVQGNASSFSLLLDTNFNPDRLLYRDGKALTTSDVAMIDTGQVYVLEPWLHWNYRTQQGQCCSLFNAEESDDILSVGAGEAGSWVDPEQPKDKPQAPSHVLLTKDAGGLHLDFPLKYGHRMWLISALDKERCLQKVQGSLPASTLPYRYVIKHGQFPLNTVKDYVLSWPDRHPAFPHLLFTKAEAQRFQASVTDKAPYEHTIQRYLADPNPLSEFTMDGAIAAYYATGDAKIGHYLADSSVRMMQEAVDFFLQQSEVTYGCAPHHAQVVGAAMTLADTALGCGLLTAEQHDRLLAQAAFLGYAISRADYWSPARGYAANPNMTTSVNGYLAAIACLVNTHPRAGEWIDSALKELKETELDHWSDANGGWLEAPHYAMVSYDQIIGALIMAHNAGVNDALYTDPKVKQVINWFSKISTPPDSRFFGCRHLPPIGNTYLCEPTGEFGLLAYLFKDKDPEFAAQMQWMYRQHKSWGYPGIGGGYPALSGYRGLLLDPTIQAAPPAWKSELSPSTVAILRNGFPGDRETMLLLLAGGFGGWRSHWDNDSGSITLWGKGRILADDFGYYGMAPIDDHSLVDSPALTSGIMETQQFTPGDKLDYVEGLRGKWRRQIMFIKDPDPLAPNYYVLCDSFPQPYPATWRLWCTAERVDLGLPGTQPKAGNDDAEDEQAAELRKLKSDTTPVVQQAQQAVAIGKEDVDLDIFFASPSALTLQSEKKTRVCNCGVYPDGNMRAMPSTQFGVVAVLKACTNITAVLYPRMKTEKPPQFTPIADGHGVKITHAAGTDYVFLSPTTITYQDENVSFSGTAGVARQRGEKVILSLGTAGKISQGKHVLQAESAQTKEF